MKPLRSDWRVESMEEEKQLSAHVKEAWVNVSSTQSGGIVAGAESGTLGAWDATGEAVKVASPKHRAVINCVRVLPDGDTVVVASSDKTMSVVSLSSGQRLHTLTQHTRKVHWLVLVPPATHPAPGAAGGPNSGWSLVSIGNDSKCIVWDVTSWAVQAVFEGHSAGVYCGVLVDGPAGTVASGDTEGSICIWNARSGALLRTLPSAHPVWVTGLAHLPSEHAIVSVAADATVRRWSLADGSCTGAPAHPAGRCTCIALLDAEAGLFATSSYNKNWAVWDGATMECLRVYRGAPVQMSSVALLPAGDWGRACRQGCRGSDAVAAGLEPEGGATPPPLGDSLSFSLAVGSLNLTPIRTFALRLKRLDTEAAKAAWDADAANETALHVEAASVGGFVHPGWWLAGAVIVVGVAGAAVWAAKAAAPKAAGRPSSKQQ